MDKTILSTSLYVVSAWYTPHASARVSNVALMSVDTTGRQLELGCPAA